MFILLYMGPISEVADRRDNIQPYTTHASYAYVI